MGKIIVIMIIIIKFALSVNVYSDLLAISDESIYRPIDISRSISIYRIVSISSKTISNFRYIAIFILLRILLIIHQLLLYNILIKVLFLKIKYRKASPSLQSCMAVS